MLNRLGVNYKSESQTDGRTDRQTDILIANAALNYVENLLFSTNSRHHTVAR